MRYGCGPRDLAEGTVYVSSIQLHQQGIHLVNFRLLARNDVAAQFLDLGISDSGFLAHENCAGMMRDHRFQEDDRP